MSNINTNKFYSKIAIEGLKQRLLSESSYLYIANKPTTGICGCTNIGTVKDSRQVVKQIIAGKKILEENVYPMIRRVNWSQRVFDEYSDSTDITDKDFFVINSSRHVYKCLFNNNGATSTIEPSSTDVYPTTTVDGYIWKYMYSLTENELRDYCTDDLIIVVSNTSVQTSAIPGTIDKCDILESGSGYETNSGHILSVVSNNVFRISDTAAAGDGRYNKSYFYISEGDGQGQISEITNYSTNSTGKFVTTASEISNATSSSTYIISPGVIITGDGTGAIVRTDIDASGKLYSTTVVNPGTGYTVATATISANNIYGANGSVIPNISPVEGHGYDAATELYARHVLISMNFEGDELGTIPTDVMFHRYGIIGGNINDNANNSFSSNSFNNTVEISYSPILGSVSYDDILTVSNVEIQVLFANSSFIRGVYTSDDMLSTNGVQFASSSGAQGLIEDFTQPDIDLKKSDVYVLNTIDEIQRSNSETETINIIIQC